QKMQSRSFRSFVARLNGVQRWALSQRLSSQLYGLWRSSFMAGSRADFGDTLPLQEHLQTAPAKALFGQLHMSTTLRTASSFISAQLVVDLIFERFSVAESRPRTCEQHLLQDPHDRGRSRSGNLSPALGTLEPEAHAPPPCFENE